MPQDPKDAMQAMPHCIESFCLTKGNRAIYLAISGVLNLPRPVLSELDSLSVLSACFLERPIENVYDAVNRNKLYRGRQSSLSL